MEKWDRLQNLAEEKDQYLKENRKIWRHFKRQLEDLEQAFQQLTNMENLNRTVYSKADAHRYQVQRLG